MWNRRDIDRNLWLIKESLILFKNLVLFLVTGEELYDG